MEEFFFYRSSLNILHDETKTIIAQLADIAQRHKMQHRQLELHNKYHMKLR